MIGLREDQQVRAQLVAGIATFLSNTTLQCGSNCLNPPSVSAILYRLAAWHLV